MSIEEVLTSSDLFSNLSQEDIQRLLPFCRSIEVETGAILLKEDDPVTHLCVVEEGRVALQMSLERPDGSNTGPHRRCQLGSGGSLRLVCPGGSVPE